MDFARHLTDGKRRQQIQLLVSLDVSYRSAKREKKKGICARLQSASVHRFASPRVPSPFAWAQSDRGAERSLFHSATSSYAPFAEISPPAWPLLAQTTHTRARTRSAHTLGRLYRYRSNALRAHPQRVVCSLLS